jgi:hypothetical protein
LMGRLILFIPNATVTECQIITAWIWVLLGCEKTPRNLKAVGISPFTMHTHMKMHIPSHSDKIKMIHPKRKRFKRLYSK